MVSMRGLISWYPGIQLTSLLLVVYFSRLGDISWSLPSFGFLLDSLAKLWHLILCLMALFAPEPQGCIGRCNGAHQRAVSIVGDWLSAQEMVLESGQSSGLQFWLGLLWSLWAQGKSSSIAGHDCFD